ncbi:MAG: DUF485 domain-containing protein [Spirochaetaceae bacterium]|jgi:uncharacterized membrane protein (DUF485 family)|nr:DUF485 domain-containing protein [Spirochaetaceae bacterium]
MDHGPAIQSGPDKASSYKSKLGVRMFIVYGIVYLGFILINTLKPKLMAVEVLFGLNLAVVYGFSLIFLAIILGLIYNYLCTKKEDELNKEEEPEK